MVAPSRLLRTYFERHKNALDVALELPTDTGSGKTLVGLLIAEWRRRTHRHRVVYACPTKQLAQQVEAAARAQNIPVVLLIGSHKNWPVAAVAQYTGGRAIAVSTYSHIFNSNSYLGDAQTLLFDDAHAAEGYVAEAWAVSVGVEHDAYAHLLDAVRGSLDPHLVSRIMAREHALRTRDDVWLIPVSVVNHHVEEIDQILSTELSGGQAHQFKMIRDGLRSCLFYVTPNGWYIRPFIPPAFDHAPFTDPTQRIYLSATLGESGELERAFGREVIARIPVPPAWERTGSGRRFIVFPDLADLSSSGSGTPVTGPDLTSKLLRIRDKQLVLTPDNRTADELADMLNVPRDERFSAREEGGLQPFIAAARGTLLAPNRYDGMDLSGEACRVMLLAGLPDIKHPQDRFLASKLRAANVLEERIRTRVTQGAGRCTRGPKDYAVVIVQGEGLLRFLSRQEIQQAMSAELQAEIGFGLTTSEVSAADLVLLARSAIDQDHVWQEDAEPDIAERRRDAVKVPAPTAASLGASAAREVGAWQAAWRKNWDDASSRAFEVYERLTAPQLRPYRALWAYLASAWSYQAAQEGSPNAADRAAQLLRTAHRAAARTTWLREVQPLPTADPANDPIDDAAVTCVIKQLDGSLRSATKFDIIASEMLAALAKPDAPQYEQAVVTLGQLLGADAVKPDGKGRADAVWVWPELWITIEAKSEQLSEGALSMDYVRQANTHLDSVRSDRGEEIPDDSVSVLISPRRIVDPDAVPIASPRLHLVAPDLVLNLALDVVNAWKQFRIEAQGAASDKQAVAVAGVMWGHRVLATQVLERLTIDPIRAV